MVAVVDLKENDGRETVEHIVGNRGQALFAKADVSDAGQVKAAIDAAASRWCMRTPPHTYAVKFCAPSCGSDAALMVSAGMSAA